MWAEFYVYAEKYFLQIPGFPLIKTIFMRIS